jgi:hypothetical protein
LEPFRRNFLEDVVGIFRGVRWNYELLKKKFQQTPRKSSNELLAKSNFQRTPRKQKHSLCQLFSPMSAVVADCRYYSRYRLLLLISAVMTRIVAGVGYYCLYPISATFADVGYYSSTADVIGFLTDRRCDVGCYR